ncbi:MAG: hypothetical protein WCF33_12890, partial [Pseudonocardiaceae bacterium]
LDPSRWPGRAASPGYRPVPPLRSYPGTQRRGQNREPPAVLQRRVLLPEIALFAHSSPRLWVPPK